MGSICCTKKWIYFGLVIGVCFIYLNVVYDSIQPGHYLNEKYVFERRTCEDYKHVVQQNIKLMDLLHDTLNTHGLYKHFLMYGSIWGPVRNYNGPPPWDHDIDIGITEEDYSAPKMRKVASSLKDQGIGVEDSMFYFGAWRVRKEDAAIDIMVFKRTWFSHMRRQGLQVWLLPGHYLKGDTFPSKFVEGDLRKVQFGNRNIYIPDVKIVKYLYRDDWWKEKKPAYFNCTNTNDFYPKLLQRKLL